MLQYGKNIKTKNLNLEEVCKDLAEDFYNYYREESLCQNVTCTSPTTRSETERWIRKQVEKKNQGQGIAFLIKKLEDDKVIGTVGLDHIEGKRADIFYQMSGDMWRKGYMKEALLGLSDYAFQDLGLIRIQEFVSTENSFSLRLLESLGFNKEALLKDYDYHERQRQMKDVYLLSQIRKH